MTLLRLLSERRPSRTENQRRTRGRRTLAPRLEALETREVLSSLPTTTVAGASVGQVLSNIVNNSALGGLTVASTSGFATSSPPNYLLLSEGGKNFGFLGYVDAAPNSFTTLSQPAGDGTRVLSSTTTVTQAANGQAAAVTQSLSASPFTLKLNGQPDTFAAAGFLYVQTPNGNFIVRYTGESDTSDGNTTFTGCTVAGSFGALTGDPYAAPVDAGAFMVQAVEPSRGFTTSINQNDLTIAANTAFTLPILSKFGFSAATAANPGYALVTLDGGTLAVVSYTGILPDSDGGYDLTGCLTATPGTISGIKTAPRSGPAYNVQATSAAPINFAFTNNAGQVPVYFALAGQQINPITNVTTYGYLAPQQTNGAPDLTKPLQFQTFGSLTSVPTYTLFGTGSPTGAQVSLMVPNDPQARLDSMRLIFSVGTAPSIPIISGKPSFPAAGNPSDPNNSINYDFIEFTERSAPNDGVLFINTTQVDQVGIPFTMQTTPKDAVKSNGVGITVSRPTLYSNYGTYINTQFSGNTNASAASVTSAFQSLTTPYRLLNPSDAISNPPVAGVDATFSTYFDAALTSFFNNYTTSGQTFKLQRDGNYFVGQTLTDFVPTYTTFATNTGTQLIIPPVNQQLTSMTFSVGELVTGPGITQTTTITGITTDSANNLYLNISPSGTSASGTYTFTLPNQYTVLQLKQTDSSWNLMPQGQTYQIYAPYFSNGTPYPSGFPASSTTAPPTPPWLAPNTAGEMVFGNLGTFADGPGQAADGQISGTGATSQILLDIENTIVSAFNRGIANAVAPGQDVTNPWNDNTTFYPTPNAGGSNWSNFYAGFLHNGGVSITAPGSTVGLAYGFAYDDQGGNDPTLTSPAKKVTITLNSLNPPTAARPIHFVSAPHEIEVGGREFLGFKLKGAAVSTDYVVVIYKKTAKGFKTVGQPITIRSDARGVVEATARTNIRLVDGKYRILVQNPKNTRSAAVSKWFHFS